MKDNTNNKDYWNNYVDYWEKKVAEANDKNVVGDKTNDNVILREYFKKVNAFPNDRVLDFGCGMARLYPIVKEISPKSQYIGVDVSKKTLEHASKEYNNLVINENLYECDGKTIPFKDNYFDKIICFGVFDACNQEQILYELLRVLKTNGVLLLTGKNHKYYENDKEALIAERNAREKGHPNYFTDVKYLKDQLNRNNMEVIEEYYFERRGDFPKNKYLSTMPNRFYEFAVIIKKSGEIREKFEKFSDIYSKTYCFRR